MRFSAEQAFEDSDAGEPVMLNRASVQALCSQHGAESAEFFADSFQAGDYPAAVDAAAVLAWLGY